jgi:YfiH family protein
VSRPVEPTPVALGPGVGAVFTTRYGGVSLPPYDELNLAHHVGDDWDRTYANRSLLATRVRADLRRLCFLRQVHGSTVVTVADRQVDTVRMRGGRVEGDALVTAAVAAPLVIMVADCVPVLLADPVARVVGAAHAGRRGMVDGIVPNAVHALIRAGARLADIRAVVGPSICPDCYEVPPAMAAQVEAAVPGSAAVTRHGTPSIDLSGGVAGQLDDMGITSVARDDRCTAEDPDLYSYRRDGVTGRFAGVVWLEP